MLYDICNMSSDEKFNPPRCNYFYSKENHEDRRCRLNGEPLTGLRCQAETPEQLQKCALLFSAAMMNALPSILRQKKGGLEEEQGHSGIDFTELHENTRNY